MTVASRLAKLSVPRASGALVRSRLHRVLDDAVQRAAVWIAAGPGSGKSTLAATWAGSRSGRVLWYRADEGDADPAVSFSFLRELARTPKRGKSLPTFTARELDRLDLFARTFFRAFFDITPAASTLVIDDAHAATGDAFTTLLSGAIAEAPHDVAVLVLSRQDPGGPMLDHLSRGSLELVPAGALAFTADEATELLADRMAPPAARELQAKLDGWAAGMLLLSHSAHDGQPDRTLRSEHIAAYFQERVLAQFDDAALRTLGALSLLPEVDSSDIHKLGCGDDATELLEALRKRHAFVARLDRQPPSWRLHDLLRDALRARFESIADASWRREVSSTAAEIAGAKGLAREAVALWLRCGRDKDARSTAERFARELVREQRLGELDAIVAMLGEGVTRQSLALQLALGESAWQRNDARAAMEPFARAYSLVREPSPSATALLIAATALGALWEGWQDYVGSETWAARVREQLPARSAITDPSEGLRIDSVCVRTMSMLWDTQLGDYQELIARIVDALRVPPQGLTPDDAVAASGVLVEAAGYFLTDKELFHTIVEATAPWLFRRDLSPLGLAGWLNAYGPLGRHWPTPGVKLPADGPVPCLELAIELAREHGGQSTAFVAATFLFYAAVGSNDVEAAARHLQTQREIADPRHVSQVGSLIDAEANMLAIQGDFQRARDAFQRYVDLADAHDFPASERWSPLLGRARADIMLGHTGEAREALLHAAPQFPEGMRRDFPLILADVASAAEALRQQGAIPPELIEKVMRRAREHSWRGVATLMLPLFGRICADALRLGIEPEFARQLVREKKLPAPHAYEPHWPWPIRIHALGGLRVALDDAPLAFGPRAQRKPLDLLKAIIAHGPAPVDSAVVLDALWPDAEGAAARAAFDMTVMRLRKLLARDDALRLDAGHIGLDPRCVWVDAYAFAHGAIDDYAGPLFGSDPIEPWWAAARERLHQRFLRRTLERGRMCENARDLDTALEIYEAGLAQDPLAEDLYQGAIRCHVAAGRPADALRVFRRCREQLSIVLSVTPSPATAALVARLS